MSTATRPAGPTTALAALTAALPTVLEALPLGRPVQAGAPAGPGVPLPEGAAAVVTGFRGTRGGTAVVVVGADLQAAVAAAEGIDLAAAVGPAIDAVAQAAGPAVADTAQVVPGAQALTSLPAGAAVVPLLDDSGAVLAVVALALDERAGATGAVPAPRAAGGGALNLLRDVEMAVTVELGRTRMTVKDLLSLTPGTVVELDRAAGAPADLLVNGRLIARGEVVVVDEDYGIRIVEIVSGEGTT
jgi:flagellar motor switch protein FliN